MIAGTTQKVYRLLYSGGWARFQAFEQHDAPDPPFSGSGQSPNSNWRAGDRERSKDQAASGQRLSQGDSR